MTYDVIVLGVGGMGSAALYHLAARGKRVLGIERYDIPHSMGSSHGLTRIIRLAYFEHPAYVPLLRRAYELWRALESQAGEQLLHITGSLDIGAADDLVVEGSLASCREHGLDHELLTAEETMRRHPAIVLPEAFRAVWQPQGGFLLSERCIVAHVSEALRRGATVKARERVLEWNAVGGGVSVTTDRDTYHAGRLVVCAGPWVAQALRDLAPHVSAERQVLGWFQPTEPDLFTPDRLPVVNLRSTDGHLYAFPVFGVPGFKIGRYHHLEEQVHPDTMDRECHLEDEATLRRGIRQFFPKADGPTMALKSCLFTNTPDEHFVIDVLPTHPEVIVAAGFSGHGFKFASVVGEVLADLSEEGSTRHDTKLFRIARLSSSDFVGR